MRCLKCGFENPNGSVVCSNCGTSLTNVNTNQNNMGSNNNLGNQMNDSVHQNIFDANSFNNNQVNQVNNMNNNMQNETNINNNSQSMNINNANNDFQSSSMNNQNNMNMVDNSSNNEDKKVKKKKLKWRIPVLLFVGSIIAIIIPTILEVVFALVISGEDVQSNNLFNILNLIFIVLAVILLLSSFISIPIVIIKYNKDDSNNQEKKLDDYLNSNASLDDKLLASFIGNNYDKIINNKFSLSACFLCVWYLFYRKIYLISIIIMIISFVIGLFLPVLSGVYTIILMACSGLLFNKLYVKYAKKKIDKIKVENTNMTEDDLIKLARQKGGVSTKALIIYIIVFVIISIIYFAILLSNGLKGKTLSCTTTESETGLTLKHDIEMTFDNSLLIGAKQKITYTIDDSYSSYSSYLEELARENAQEYMDHGCDVDITNEGNEIVVTISFDIDNMSELDKSYFDLNNPGTYESNKNALENDGYTCK